MTTPETRAATPDADSGPLAVICGGGTLPFAVASAAAARGRRVVLFPLRGWADPARTAAFPHHWISLGQFGRFLRLARKEGCRDLVWIGSLVRPAISQLRFDLITMRLLPELIKAFRGGDNHLLTSLGRIFEAHGFRLLGAQDVVHDLLLPEGPLTGARPSGRDRADIEQALAIIQAAGPFDVGQAAVVANKHCLAIEGAEGTDQLLERIVAMRASGRVRTPRGVGVLVKAPKPGQDRRFDLPAIGPQTVEGVVRAGLAGIAVAADSTIAAEVEQLAGLAERNGIFVVGIRPDGAFD
jgi:DUF1009 family protein